MSASTVIACPECQKKFKGREELEGKKVKCPACGHPFIVKTGGPGKPDSAPPPPAAPKAAKKLWDEEEDQDSNPYGVTHLDLAARCPHCANLMASEDAVICLYCGYNTQTRQLGSTKKTIQHTGGERFLWLLPGLACVAGIIFLINVAIFYCLALPGLLDKTSWAEDVFDAESTRLWLAVLPSLAMMWGLGYFGFKRLVLEPTPPEKEKD
jgi:DNA-directed RNA polymerase subunit RPC12/RpoP